jgi:hypothetical protein
MCPSRSFFPASAKVGPHHFSLNNPQSQDSADGVVAVLATSDPITLGCSYWFATKDWLVNTFPRHLFHRAENKRAPIPQHTKQMLALREPAEDGGKHEGWMLLGSHNPTQAAWGKLQYPKGKTQPQSE